MKTTKYGGQYRRFMMEQKGERESNEYKSFFYIRFYFSLCLFVAYMILDYTKTSIEFLDSRYIYDGICQDALTEFPFDDELSHMIDSITKEIYIQ